MTTPDFRALCAELVCSVELLLDMRNSVRPMKTTEERLNRARAALATPPGPPKNCWLDDEPDLCPSLCVFDDPSEVISNCDYAETVKCKTDCKYYRAAAPPPEPPTDEELDALWIEQYGWTGQLPAMSIAEFKPAARAVLERWGNH